MKYLVVVDMQRDFVTGSLGTKEAEAVLPRVIEKVRDFEGRIIFTRDTHTEDYLETLEGRNLPVKHCVKGEEGWRLAGSLEAMAQASGWKVYDKPAFGCPELAAGLKEENDKGENPVEEIELCGLCTDICVISNALMIKAFLPETPVIVDAACCAGVTPRSHQNALEAMKMCQIEIRNE